MKIRNISKQQNFLESLVVFGTLTAILLPLRLVFVQAIGDSWIGSFGIVSIAMVTLIVLIKKNKLGWFGQMFQRQLRRFYKSKRKWLVYTQSLILILLTATFVYGINEGNTTYADIKKQFENYVDENDLPLDDPERLLGALKDYSFQEWLKGIILFPIAIVVDWPQITAMFATMNDRMFDGWLLHFLTIFLVEEIEILSLFVYTKFTKPY